MNLSPLVKVAGKLGGYWLARQASAGYPRILMYHRFSHGERSGHVSAKTFEAQVSYLARHCHPLTVTDIVAGVYEGKNLPRGSVAITVDDGYHDFYDVAWPILKKYRVPATFYVTTGFVDGSLWLWPDQLRWLLDNAPDVPGTYQIGSATVATPLSEQAKESCFNTLVAYLLSVPDDDKHACLLQAAQGWQLVIPARAPAEYAPVTWGQLQEMQADGLEVGGHTVTHPSLGRVSLDKAKDEIFGSYKALSKQLGDRPRSFCYPNGQPQDFVGEQAAVVREAGYSAAVVAFADASGHCQRFAMRRHSSSADSFQFMKAVSGLEYLGLRLRGKRFSTAYE